MATQIAKSDGNLTSGTNFGTAEAGALALVLNRNTIESLANNATVTSATFTVTNAKVIDAVLLWVRQGAAGSTGTFKVDLQKGGVSQASVTVNRTDLPAFISGQAIGDMVPVLFKLGSTATGDGGSNWTIVLTNSNGTNAVSYAAATASTTNFTRALRTTTAANPAAADDIYVIGELTGAGTHNTRTITMDSTAATAYGNGSVNSTTVAGGLLSVSEYGTLTYGTTASTNYVLRVNGDLMVWENGTLNIGASGAEIPRTSTAVLEFQMASASGDFGLWVHNNGTCNISGLSRTSAKNIVQCKLTADVTGSNVLTSGPTALNVTNATSGGLDAGGTSLLASTAIDTVTNANHTLSWSAPSITNTTQSFQVWLARGTGTNNRFVRLEVGNNSVLASVTKGFFADVDLQAGTIGTCTAVGTGTATSASIQAVGGGFLCTIVGKVDGSAATPSVFIAICSAAGTTSFAGANNQALLYEGVQLVTTSSIGDTTFNVDTDTGWLSGDQIIVAATSRTGTDCENFVLSANAGASSVVSHLYPFGYGGPTVNVAGTHNGTSPIQGEIGLLTRNVKIRSTSNSLFSYVYFEALATVTCLWAEFYYIGSSNTHKHGIEADGGTTANAKSITFCSVHDCFDALQCTTGSSTSMNITFSNNVVWNTSSTAIVISAVLTNTDWTFDSNLLMKLAGTGFSFSDVGGTCTNNTVVGIAAGVGFLIGESASAAVALGTFNNLVAHACAGNGGMTCQSGDFVGTISNYTGWRNGSGIFFNSVGSTADLIFNNITLFGNSTASGQINGSTDVLNMTGTNIIAGDTTFSSSSGIGIGQLGLYQVNIVSLDMSGSTSIFAAHTSSDLNFSGAAAGVQTVQGTMNNCKFGAPTVIANRSAWGTRSYIGFERYGQTAGDHRCEMTYGTLKTDSTFFNTASPSMRMTPSNASNKLESAPKGGKGIIKKATNGGGTSISVYIRKSAVGDGAAYTGNQPRLIQRANPALGQSSDVVLATYSSGTGSWNQLSATSSTATDDGGWEFIVDCDGTAGWINVDDWA